MRRILVAVITSVAAGISLSGEASGQDRPSGRGVIVGTVREAGSGRPVVRAYVCTELTVPGRLGWSRCTAVDSSTAFRVDSLPEGIVGAKVLCGTVRLFGKEIASDSIRVSEAAPVRRNWIVDTAGCDPRPLRSVTGEFRGYYTPGFESSEFVPCVADAWFLPSDSLRTGPHDQRRAWARLSQARFPDGFQLQDATRDSYGNPRYYVHWRGTVVGPGSYGHLGISAFELRVDSVMELRATRSGDCPPVQDARGDPRPGNPAGRAPADTAAFRSPVRRGTFRPLP